jgi:hypothetical protein
MHTHRLAIGVLASFGLAAGAWLAAGMTRFDAADPLLGQAAVAALVLGVILSTILAVEVI